MATVLIGCFFSYNFSELNASKVQCLVGAGKVLYTSDNPSVSCNLETE